ncbi:MAG: hypothetical protein ABJA64_02290 [Candidatus Saccharibacteria bacterium]
MLVILHVLIALSSIIAVSVAFALPSAFKLRLSYVTIAATLMSGTYLVVVAPAHMVQACESGLVYTAVVLVGIMATRAKLARLELDRAS